MVITQEPVVGTMGQCYSQEAAESESGAGGAAATRRGRVRDERKTE